MPEPEDPTGPADAPTDPDPGAGTVGPAGAPVTVAGGDGDDVLLLGDGYENTDFLGGETGEVDGDLIWAGDMTQGVTLRYTGNEQGTIDGTGQTVTFAEVERIVLGSGNDYVEVVAPTSGVVNGGDGFDILDLGETPEGETPPVVRITERIENPDGTTRLSGTVTFADGTVLQFKNFEKIICFTPGTRIDTDRGPVAVEDLRPGDRVLTRDHGFRPLVWTGRRDLPAAAVARWPELAPVRIAAGALGAGLPVRDLVVSPGHRMLVAGARAEVLFGEREVLVAAADLVGLPGIARQAAGAVSYLHVMCAGHEIIRAEGAWTESFQPSAGVLDGLAEGTRAELMRLFPELATPEGRARLATAARPVLSPAEARLLVA
jgi:hypothetical protein